MRFCGVLTVCLIGLASGVLAQEQPKLDVVFEETETVPGQPLTLRLTVLVPTFMPNPPVWPDLESPNLMVRLPEKASSPTSKSVNGETWSGISRRYQITPMVPGNFSIAPGTVTVTYQNDGGDGVVQAELPVPELSVVGIMPEGAEGLDPFIATQELTLSQTVEGEAEALDAGGSFSRVISAKLKGVSPIFVPPLTPDVVPEGLRAYPETPTVEETEDRGILGGTRNEKTVYVAEAAVDGVLPELTIRWYNLKSKSVEEAVLPEVAVRADAPAGGSVLPSSAGDGAIDRSLIGVVAAMFGALLLIWSLRGRMSAGLMRWQNRWLASETYAWRDLQKSIRARDLSAARQAFAIWQGRCGGQATEQARAVEDCFLALGSGFFGTHGRADSAPQWTALEARLKDLRRALAQQRRITNPALAALNPVSAARK